MSHNAFFSSRSGKAFFLDVDIVVKKQLKIWFIVVCTLIDNEYLSLLFSQTFFRILSACYTSLQKFLKGKSDAYITCPFKSESAFSIVKTKIYFVIFDIVVKKPNRMWFSVVCTLIENDTPHQSGQNLMRLRLASPQHFDHCDDAYRCR